MPGEGGERASDQRGNDVATAPLKEGALISARGLSLRHPGDDRLQHVDIDISPGEFVTLVGPDGGGKTTLVNLLLGLLAPITGSVHRADDCIVGLVPQCFSMPATIPMTVERFLTLGRRRDRASQSAVLADVGAGTIAERQVADLEPADLQRVLIARALLRSPTLLVLDEPARGADYAGAADMYGLASRLRGERGLAILLVAREFHASLATSDRIVCINHGIVAEGRPGDVICHPAVARLYGPLAAMTFAAPTRVRQAATTVDQTETRR